MHRLGKLDYIFVNRIIRGHTGSQNQNLFLESKLVSGALKLNKIQYLICLPLVLGRCSQTSVLSLAGSLRINDR